MSALIFDCDGVLADTERDGHLPAFNATFAHFGLPVRWSEEVYGEKLRIGGGKERMASLFEDQELVERAHLPTEPAQRTETLASWHAYKTSTYVDMVSSGKLPGRPGVVRLVDEALDAGWSLAVASTSAHASVFAVLTHVVGEERARRFVVAAGDIVPRKKPDPGIYHAALKMLGVDSAMALAIEDSRNGLLAARAAGVCCIVTVSSYTGHEDMSEAALVSTSLGDPGEPMQLLQNRSQARPGSMLRLQDLSIALVGASA